MCLFSTIVFLYGYLRNFRQFYLTYPNPEIYYTVCSKLTWSHNRLIMGMNDANACCFYLKEVTRQSWSVRQLERNINHFIISDSYRQKIKAK